MCEQRTIYNFRKELQGLGYSKSVVNNYPKYAQSLLEYSKENPKKITDKHLKNYYEYLKTKPNQRRKGTISERHIYAQLSAVKLYFEYLERTGEIKRNPYNLKVKQPIRKERTVLTPEEITELYNACKSLQETIIIHLCYGCGLRRSEAEHLNTKDIDYEKKLLYIRKGKGKKRRVIPLTETIIIDFKQYREKESESFLLNKWNTRMTGNKIYETFKKILKRTELDQDYTLHNLRHSIATHLLENGMSIEMVRDFLGHSQLVTTQVYTRINLHKLKMKS